MGAWSNFLCRTEHTENYLGFHWLRFDPWTGSTWIRISRSWSGWVGTDGLENLDRRIGPWPVNLENSRVRAGQLARRDLLESVALT